MRQIFTGVIFSDGAANSLLASLTGAGLAVTLVLAAIILAAAVLAVISIVKRRKHNKGGCHGCGGCGGCGGCIDRGSRAGRADHSECEKSSSEDHDECGNRDDR